jgi:hypothetical protein
MTLFHGSESHRKSPSSRQFLSVPSVVFPRCDAVLPFLARFSAEHQQASRLKQYALATTVFGTSKIHDTRRQQTQGNYRVVECLIIAVHRDTLAWEIFVDQHLIETAGRDVVGEHPFSQLEAPLWNSSRRAFGAAIVGAVQLPSSLPGRVPSLGIDCRNKLVLRFAGNVVRKIPQARYFRCRRIWFHRKQPFTHTAMIFSLPTTVCEQN